MSHSEIVPGASLEAEAAVPFVSGVTIADYLIRRLQDYGIEHVFGIPGDYVLAFYARLSESPIKVIGCTREDNAGFAADAYARVRGMGAICVTYCVGGLSVCNSIAGAYAEKSPVLVITGSPGLRERVNDPFLHHRVREFRTQLEVFEKICVAATELSDPPTAFREIDRVLHAVARYKRPGYIEIPRDMVRVVPDVPYRFAYPQPTSEPQTLAEAADEAVSMISRSKKPVIIAGVEIHRFGLEDRVTSLAEQARIPIAATLLGKSAIRETHPLYVGLYEGAMSRDEVTQFVEESDCIILLGEFMTDINLGIFTAKLDPTKCILANSETLQIRHHRFDDVLLGDFIREVTARNPRPGQRTIPVRCGGNGVKVAPRPAAPLTIAWLFGRLNEALTDDTIVIADVGDALFGASDLVIRQRTEFLSPAYYTSMGFAIPATVGASFARPKMRVVAIVGDGAFQMTGMELSTIVRHHFNPVVIVLDNKGYGTERFLHAGEFNDIHPWHYHKLPEILGSGNGFEVRTEEEFDRALRAALADQTQMSLIQAHIGLDDRSKALDRLADKLSKRV